MTGFFFYSTNYSTFSVPQFMPQKVHSLYHLNCMLKGSFVISLTPFEIGSSFISLDMSVFGSQIVALTMYSNIFIRFAIRSNVFARWGIIKIREFNI